MNKEVFLILAALLTLTVISAGCINTGSSQPDTLPFPPPNSPLGDWYGDATPQTVNGTEYLNHYRIYFPGNDSATMTWTHTERTANREMVTTYRMEGEISRNEDNYTITTKQFGNFTMLCSFTEDGAWHPGPVILPDGTEIAMSLHLLGYNTNYR